MSDRTVLFICHADYYGDDERKDAARIISKYASAAIERLPAFRGEPTVIVTVDIAEACEKRTHHGGLWTLNEDRTDWGPTIPVEDPSQLSLAV